MRGIATINQPIVMMASPRSRRGRKKSLGRLVVSEAGTQAFVIGYDKDGFEVTVTRAQAEEFAANFYVVRKSLHVRFITFLYNRYGVRK